MKYLIITLFSLFLSNLNNFLFSNELEDIYIINQNEIDSLKKNDEDFKFLREISFLELNSFYGNSKFDDEIFAINLFDDKLNPSTQNRGFISNIQDAREYISLNNKTLKKEFLEAGMAFQSGTLSLDDNNSNFTRSYFLVDLRLGIGKGYGWKSSKNKSIYLNNHLGLAIGFYSQDFVEDALINNSGLTGMTRDYFTSDFSYPLNENVNLLVGVSRFNVYEEFHLFEGMFTKVVEVGLMYGTDYYIIEPLAGKNTTFGPIINVLIQNGISHLVYSLKKSNTLFPFEGGKGYFGYQFQLGINVKFNLSITGIKL